MIEAGIPLEERRHFPNCRQMTPNILFALNGMGGIEARSRIPYWASDGRNGDDALYAMVTMPPTACDRELRFALEMAHR